jgi:hypothetical protein
VTKLVVAEGGQDMSVEVRAVPGEGFYLVWYYLRQKVDPSINVFQWKKSWMIDSNSQTRRLLYWVRADWNDNANAFNFHLRTKANNNTGQWDGESRSMAISSREVPLNTWVHLECSYKWSKTGNGRIVCWQDGTKILEFNNLNTEYNWDYLRYPRQWTINNYTGSHVTTPKNHTIYVDAAAIATSRLGL